MGGLFMHKYESNGIYNFLRETEGTHNFMLVDITKSVLIVSKKDTMEPMLLVLDDRIQKDEVGKDFGEVNGESEALFVGGKLSEKVNIPLVIIRYVDTEEELSDASSIEIFLKKPFMEICEEGGNLQDLIDLFNRLGIKAYREEQSPEKDENDSLSSGFHKWQREHLNIGIFSDIDLVRICNEEVVAIYELKRSYISMEEWRPYLDDINDYIMLIRFCEVANIPFSVVFVFQANEKQYADILKSNEERINKYYYETRKMIKNQQEKYYDDVSRIKMFDFYHSSGRYEGYDLIPHCKGIVSIETFVDNEVYNGAQLMDWEKYWNESEKNRKKRLSSINVSI